MSEAGLEIIYHSCLLVSVINTDNVAVGIEAVIIGLLKAIINSASLLYA